MPLLRFFSSNSSWILPLLLMAVLTPFLSTWDLLFTNHYFNPGQGPDGLGFPSPSWATFLYKYGPYPALITFLLATVLLVGSFFHSPWNQWRKPALVLFLTYAVGSGLICHAILKDHWGRPRPKQTVEFGGTQPYRPYYKPNIFHQPQPSKSFPCGHCSTGFYFFALALVGRRLNSPFIFWTGIVLALGLGIALSWTRIIQGGHFLSDTLASAIIMWVTAWTVDRILYKRA